MLIGLRGMVGIDARCMFVQVFADVCKRYSVGSAVSALAGVSEVGSRAVRYCVESGIVLINVLWLLW